MEGSVVGEEEGLGVEDLEVKEGLRVEVEEALAIEEASEGGFQGAVEDLETEEGTGVEEGTGEVSGEVGVVSGEVSG